MNTSLVVLNLEDNGIGDWGATAIADAFAVNKTLTHLNLSGNGIGVCINIKNTYINIQLQQKNGGIALANALASSNNVLHTLILNNNPLLDETAAALSTTLQS